MLATFGDNAPGITVGGAGSVATLHIRDVGDTAYGSGFQTNGANSTLFDIGMGGNSSSSFWASASSFGTVGDGSAVVSIANGEGSDQTVVLDDVRIVSAGSDAPGLFVSLTDRDSVGNIVAVGTSISTAGDRSGGIVWRTGGNDSLSVNNLTLAEVEISTLGDDAPALLVERGGQVSTRTTIVQGFDVSTDGDRSSGMVIGGLLQRSVTEIDLADGVVVTAGDSAHAIVIGEVAESPLDLFDKGVWVDLANIDITTTGNDAMGLLLLHSGSDDQGSDFRTTLTDITVSTSGDASHGIVLGAGLGTGLPTTINELTLAGVSATTSGAEAHAFVIGENATLTLDAGNIGETTDRGTIVSGLIDTFDGFVATGTNGRAVMNHGMIFGTFTLGDEIVGNLANNGLIESADGPAGVAVQFTGTTDDIFELQPLGEVIGTVDAGLGTDAFILGGEGEASFDVGLLDANGTPDGDDKYVGFESFSKIGTSNWTLTGSNGEITLFSVAAGSLLNNASLMNAEIALNGGTLGGTGTVGSVTVGDGGALSPGNSIGTLTVAGTTVFNAGSIFEVEVDAAGNTDVLATGAVEINGGIVSVLAAEGDYEPSTTYTILTSTAPIGISDRFDDVTSNYAFLTPTLGYEANRIDLTLERNELGFMSFSPLMAPTITALGAPLIAYTPNQAATGAALDALADAPYDELDMLTVEDIPAALDALSGEGHASVKGALLEGRSAIRTAVFDRVQQAFEALESAGALGYAAGGGYAPPEPGAVIWGRLHAGIGVLASDGNAGETTASAAGFLIGADQRFGDLRLGLFAGAGRSGISARHMEAESTDLTLGAYGGTDLGVVQLKFGASLTHHGIETARTIGLPGADETATASYGATTMQAFGEIAHRMEFGATALTPFASLAVVGHATEAFSETGAAGALSAEASSLAGAFTTLGLRAEHRFVLGDGMLARVEGSLGWRHAFADLPTSTHGFAGGDAFSVAAAPIAADSIALGVRLGLDIGEGLAVSLGYDGQFGSGLAAHSGRVTVGGRF